MKNIKAFSLLELIVVITILAILGIIAFISLQGYSSNARDSSRISDINQIKTALGIQSIAKGKYPMPDNYNNATWSGTVIARHQGNLGDNVTKILSKTLTKKPIDPLYNTEYIYSITPTQFEYEVMSIYESDIVYNSLSKVKAASNIVRIDGTYNGIYVKTQNYIIPTPSIINSLLDGADLALNSTTIESQVINGGTNIPNIGTNKVTLSTGGLDFNTFEVYSGIINSDSEPEDFLATYNAIANTYSGSSLVNDTIIQTLLSQTSILDKINFTKSLILNTGITTFEGEINTSSVYNCNELSKPTDNGNIIFVTGNPIEIDQEYIQNAENCGYNCKNGYIGTSCDILPLLTSTDCNNAGWIWVNGTNDVYIGTNKGIGFCISPIFGDWNNDSELGNGGISLNNWGNHPYDPYRGWGADSICDSGENSSQYGQTRKLDSQASYSCKPLGTASYDFDFDIGDTIIGRMKWLATTGNTYSQARSIDWITGLIPLTSGTYPQTIGALYIADCIDGVKDLGTDMVYTHKNNETDEITYSEYSSNSTSSNILLGNIIYQNRQKYLTAWTQKSGSHLPSAFAYIENGTAGGELIEGSATDWDLYTNAESKGEYQVACEAGLLGSVTWNGNNQFIGSNDDVNNENIWTSAIGRTTGYLWTRSFRTIGNKGCGDQHLMDTTYHGGTYSARFIVRP